MICKEDHDQILADPNATTDELRSIIAELHNEHVALIAALANISGTCEVVASECRVPQWQAFFLSIGRTADNALPPST